MIVEPPSLPLNIKSLSDTLEKITRSLLEFVNLPYSVPSSLSKTLPPPSASKIISPATSIVKLPELKSISVPSIVMLSTVIPPSASSFVVVSRPVLGLYVKSPSDSRPKLPPSTSPPAVKIMALVSFVDSLSVIVTVVAIAAVSYTHLTLPTILRV